MPDQNDAPRTDTGFVIAFSNANGVFWKYMKAYALHQSS